MMIDYYQKCNLKSIKHAEPQHLTYIVHIAFYSVAGMITVIPNIQLLMINGWHGPKTPYISDLWVKQHLLCCICCQKQYHMLLLLFDREHAEKLPYISRCVH